MISRTLDEFLNNEINLDVLNLKELENLFHQLMEEIDKRESQDSHDAGYKEWYFVQMREYLGKEIGERILMASD